MAGRTKTRANFLRALTEDAMKLADGIYKTMPRDIARKSHRDEVDEEWVRVSSFALEVAFGLADLRDVYRQRAGLPPLYGPDEIPDRPTDPAGSGTSEFEAEKFEPPDEVPQG